MKRCLLVIVCLLFMLLCPVKAQEVTVTGRIFDNKGLEILGATIVVKDKPIDTFSDIEGKYTISCYMGDTLRVSYLGFEKQEWIVDSKKKDFFLKGDENVFIDGDFVYPKYSIMAQTGYLHDAGKIGGGLFWGYHFYPYQRSDYGNSLYKRLTRWLAPTIGYQFLPLKNETNQLITTQLLSRGYGVNIKPLHYRANISAQVGYYLSFDEKFRYWDADFHFSITSKLYSFSFDNRYYSGRRRISFLAGYNIYTGHKNYNHIFFTVRYTLNAAEPVSHVLNSNDRNCKWYDKVFF